MIDRNTMTKRERKLESKVKGDSRPRKRFKSKKKIVRGFAPAYTGYDTSYTTTW